MGLEALVRRRVSLINEGKFSALGDVLHADAITHYGSGEPVRGLESLVAVLEGFQAFPDLKVSIEEVVTDGDFVAARYTSRGTHRAPFAGIPGTGTAVEFGGAGIHHVRGDKIDEVWVVDDLATLTRQLGNSSWTHADSESDTATRPAKPAVETNRAAVRRWIELVNARKLDDLREVWADDLVLHQGPDQPALVGFDNFRALLDMFYAAMPDLQISVEDVVAGADTVILRSASTGTHTGDLFGIPPTGRKVTYVGVGTYHLANGKITHEWFNDDMFSLVQALTAPDTAA
ncbi:ester cyclase [Streptomyces sp. NBC_00005]|uniref:ester cyclase n=1 Tax=Streptomyces sp. NBC_00005 TaxID=2903609 RepID=UPI00325509D7